MWKIVLTAVTASVFASVLSACSLFPRYSDLESIEIDGERYVTGFYENLWPDGTARRIKRRYGGIPPFIAG